MTIINQGIARWLEMQYDPVSLWPYLKQFWIAQGFEIIINEPINGILETEWKKNQINFESEGKLLNNKDFNYNSSKEKFRVRVERQPNGYTNIYVSNHVLEADDVVNEGKIIWKKKESDLSREAEMLVRMMEYFGNNRDVALESLNESGKYDNKVSIDLIDFYGVPAILIEESFSKMWRKIGLSLDRSGLLVTDQNRDTAIYIISTDQISNKETSYEIKLTKREDKYIITAHKLNKSKITNRDARKILKHIMHAYGADIVSK
jgi:outer membrane protein assembly factor BamC